MPNTIVRYYKTSDKQLSIVCGRGISKRFPMHRHISLSIGMVVNGMRILKINSKNYLIGKGDVFIINSGEAHAIGKNEIPEHDYIVVSISPVLIEKYLGSKENQFENIIESSEISILLQQWFNLLIDKPKKENFEFRFEELIKKLSNFKKSEKIIKPENSAIEKIRIFIDKESSLNHSLESLAERAFLSPFHFSRLFKNHTGLAPHQYILDNRLRQARELLENNFSVLDIAITCGFYDASHFIRHFTKYFGVSPMEYQKGINKLT
jgi:AraC-like DNA-binding protein